MSILLYRLVVGIYHLGIRLVGFLNPKAMSWVDGRRNWRENLQHWRNSTLPTEKVVWMHCASLGEFEQGRPILEQLRHDYPALRIVLSFYSPSGYEQRKHYVAADYVCYLPADTPSNAQDWLRLLRPNLIVFVKYEFWYFHLDAAFKQKVPVFLIAAAFRPDQLFFRWYGGAFLKLLHQFKKIHVQTWNDRNLLERYGIRRVVVSGDPRVDQVLSIAEEEVQYPIIASFAMNTSLFIAGSTWPAGEEILLREGKWWVEDWKLLVAPHDISEGHIQQIIDGSPLPVVRYSEEPSQAELQNARILILDTIGMLSRVYRYGHLAYIGGGFGRGIHNTLEPAAYGLPILFGPKYKKFAEAIALNQRGGAFVVNDQQAFSFHFATLHEPTAYAVASQEVRAYVQENRGATERIIADVSRHLRPA